jgi:hypothetical protein
MDTRPLTSISDSHGHHPRHHNRPTAAAAPPPAPAIQIPEYFWVLNSTGRPLPTSSAFCVPDFRLRLTVANDAGTVI